MSFESFKKKYSTDKSSRNGKDFEAFKEKYTTKQEQQATKAVDTTKLREALQPAWQTENRMGGAVQHKVGDGVSPSLPFGMQKQMQGAAAEKYYDEVVKPTQAQAQIEARADALRLYRSEKQIAERELSSEEKKAVAQYNMAMDAEAQRQYYLGLDVNDLQRQVDELEVTFGERAKNQFNNLDESNASIKRADKLNQELQLAKYYQTAQKYDDYVLADDFERYSTETSAMGQGWYDLVMGRDVLPSDRAFLTSFDEYDELVEKYGEDSEEIKNYLRSHIAYDDGKVYAHPSLYYMSEQERKIYAYIYNKEGQAAAAEFLTFIGSNLEQRRATADFERRERAYDDLPLVSKEAFKAADAGLEVVRAYPRGIKNAAKGVVDYFSDEVREYGYDDYERQLIAKKYDGTSVGTAIDVSESVGQMTPAIASKFIPYVGEYVSNAIFYTSAAGNAKQEMLRNGYTATTAAGYGNAIGLSELLTEKVLGGIPGISKGNVGKIGNKIFGKVLAKLPDGAQTFLRSGINIAGNAIGESVEERVQSGLVEPFLGNSLLGEDNSYNLFSEEADEAAKIGFWSGLVMNVANIGGTIGKADAETKANNLLVDTAKFDSAAVKKARTELADALAKGEVTQEGVDKVVTAVIDEISGIVNNEINEFVSGEGIYSTEGENGAQSENFVTVRDTLSDIAKGAFDIAIEDAADKDMAASEFHMKYYEGKTGAEFTVDNDSELMPSMQKAAYDYGVKAAAEKLVKSVNMTVERGKVKVAEGTNFSRNGLNSMSTIAADTNTGITVGGKAPVDENGKQTRGWYYTDDGRIHIYADAEVTVYTNKGVRTFKGEEAATMVVLGHEMTHRLKTLNKDGYSRFESFVLSKVGDAEVKRRMENHGWSETKAKEEITCDFAMQYLFADVKTIREITRTDSKLAQKIREIINWIKSKLGLDGSKKLTAEEYKLKQMLDEAAKLWNDAYRTSVSNVKNGVENAVKETNADGEVVVETDGNGGIKFSESTYEIEGKQYLEEWLDQAVAREDIERADADSIINQLDTIYQAMQQFHGKYSSYDGWRVAEVIREENGNPLLSVVKENGEYAMNLDFSLVCKKRRALDAVFGEMIRRGTIGNFNLNEQGIATINNIIKKHGLEIACDLCFVDAKRYRQGRVADQFSDMYNNLVKSLVKDKSKISSFNFATGETSEGITTMDDSELDFTKIDKVLAQGKEKTVAYGIAKLLKENPESRKFVSRADFMNSDGFAAVKRTAPEVLKLYNKKKGSGGPKASFSDVQYMNDVLKDNRFYADAAYAVGGVRIQSFSDYIARLVFDYAQEVADLSAKKLPAHSYTKEALFAKQFGLTGIKINLSLIPKIVDGGIAPGLDAKGNYAWADESFDFDTAVEIENAEGYKENCGTIAVGVSKAHIEKMLGDDNIRMIIPYHKSSLNPVVAEMRNIKGYTDYTSKQNTRDKSTGKKLTNAQRKSEPNFNELLKEHKNPKEAADAYLKWCEENNYIPKFDEFAGHDNYYKLLTDFAVYDAEGNYHPQGAVTMTFPDADSAFGDMVSLIESGLAEDQKNADALTSELSSIVDEIEATLPLGNADFEMKRTGLGLSLNMPFSKLDAPAEIKNTADSTDVKSSTSGDEMNLFASIHEQREVWRRVQKMTPMQIANMQLEDIDPLPKRTPKAPSGINADNGKESKFFGSAMDSDNVAEDTKRLIKTVDDIRYYAGVSNEETLNEANDRLNLKGLTENNRFFALAPNSATAVDVAEGFILLKRYQDKGDFESACEVARKLREIGTSAGQTVQTFSILGRLTPEGMAVYAQKELDQVRDEMIKKHSEVWVEQRKDMFSLSAEEMQFIKDNMIAASKLPDGREKTVLIAQIASMLEEKLPKKVLKQIQAYTRVSMLLNSKTMLRNILGNAIMMPMYAVEDFVGAGFDKVLATKSGVRTKGMMHFDKETGKAAVKGVYESFDDFRRHVNTRNIENDRFEIGGGDAFRWYGKKDFKDAKGIKKVKWVGYGLSDMLNAVDRINSFLLDIGDRPFFEFHFTNSINNQLRLNHTTEPTADMVRIATAEALQRTWQDDNAFTKAASQIRNMLNGGKAWGIGSIIVPFTKTPTNLTKALVEYSPVGLVKAITYNAHAYSNSLQNAHPDSMVQKRFVDSFAKGVTGTLVMAIASALAYFGVVSGGDDDKDKDLAAFEKNIMGIAPYSVTLNGRSYSYDWAQPVGGLFAITADYVQNVKAGAEPKVKGLDTLGSYGKAILNALSAGGNVLFEQSFLQGVSELFGDDGLMGGLISAIANAPTQAIPTAISQIAQLSDPYARTSYVYRDTIGTAINKVNAKLPWERQELAPVVDVLGHDVLAYGGNNAWYNVFLNPANMYSTTATDAAKEIYRVYEETGDATVIPRVAPYYFEYKDERYTFTPHERADYQRATGSTNERIVNDLKSTYGYMKLSDEDKANALTLVTDYATANAKYEYLAENGVKYERDSWMIKAAEGVANGVTEAEYIIAKTVTKGIVKGLPDKNGETYDNSKSLLIMEAIYSIPNLSEEKRKYLFESFGVGSKVRGYTREGVQNMLSKMRAQTY